MCVIVSIKDQGNRQYGVYILVPEELVELSLERGVKPKEFLSNFIEKIYQENDFEALFSYVYGKGKSVGVKRNRSVAPLERNLWSTWSYKSFNEFMNRLLLQVASTATDKDLISFLIAYYKLGPRPTSEMLRKALNIKQGDTWYERLRVMKARLTISAKHMRLPGFFLRAYGSGLMRKHPIDNQVYSFIQEWFNRNSEILSTYDTE